MTTTLHSQKKLSRSYFIEGLQSIQIDANGVHSFKIKTAKTHEVTLHVATEGELSEAIVVHEK